MSYKPRILSTDAGGTGRDNLTFPASGTVASTSQLGLSSLKNIPELFEDFQFTMNPLGGLFTSSVASSGSVSFPTSTVNHPGLVSLNTLVNPAGRAAITNGATVVGCVSLGDGTTTVTWLVQIPTLSDGTNSFSCLFGLNTNPGGPFNGAMFTYTHSVNSGNWSATTNNASTSTNTDTTTPVVAATWYELTLVINSAGTSVDFFINGTLRATNTTNMPIAPMAFEASITKSLGATGRTALVDAFYYKCILNNARFT